ncbi:amidohydrolase family protein [Streptomyces blattellae]|uniref:amidohydrolase family protein n=1 Tax=Streptomyces blattellae TaxID=2569855 RepID=UPI002E22A4D8
MLNKIALEEHFGATDPDIVEQSAAHFTADAWPAHRDMLLDIHDDRLRIMDECGIEKAVLSLLSPGIQSLHEPKQAVDWARRLNDYAARQVSRRPDRFASFAALPLQDPDAAVAELRRAVGELGLVGALVNGFSQVGDAETVVYLDDSRYAGFWATVEELGVPVYLHPPTPSTRHSPSWRSAPCWAASPCSAYATTGPGIGLGGRPTPVVAQPPPRPPERSRRTASWADGRRRPPGFLEDPGGGADGTGSAPPLSARASL